MKTSYTFTVEQLTKIACAIILAHPNTNMPAQELAFVAETIYKFLCDRALNQILPPAKPEKLSDDKPSPDMRFFGEAGSVWPPLR